jgi:F0F1-type ATP synthase beta subunit
MLCLAGREHILGIHREAPSFIEQGTEQEILETGIKVIRLLSMFSFFSMNVELRLMSP